MSLQFKKLQIKNVPVLKIVWPDYLTTYIINYINKIVVAGNSLKVYVIETDD